MKCEVHAISHKLVGPEILIGWYLYYQHNDVSEVIIVADHLHKLLVQNSKNLAQEAEIQCFPLPLQPLKPPPSSLSLRSMRLRPSSMLSTSGPSAQCPITNLEAQTQKFLETVLEADQELSGGGAMKLEHSSLWT